MEWKPCANEECLNGKDGGRAYIDASKPYSRCFKCNQEKKEQPTLSTGTNFKSDTEEYKQRLMLLSYVKDLVCSGKINLVEMPTWFKAFRQAVSTGELPMVVPEVEI